MSKSRISQQDIAEACGVSRNTVSLALRNSPLLKEATRNRIQQTAEEMGYVVDPELGKLMTRLRERNKKEIHAELAFVHTLNFDKGKLPHWQYEQPARAYLERQGYKLRPYHLDEERGGYSEEQLGRILVARGVEGVLIGPMRPRLDRIDLPWDQLSAVALGRALDYPRVPKVDNDAYESMQICYRKLRERGCRRIGALIPFIYDGLIRRAYRSAFMGESSLEPVSDRVEVLDVNRPHHRELTREEFEAWRKKFAVDGVIGLREDYLHLGAYGYRMPGDFQFACPLLRDPSLGCPGVRSNDLRVGESAAEQLLFAIHHGIRGSREAKQLTLISGDWMEGE